MSLDIQKIRKQFPLISQSGIAYLDNSATTQKPQVVLDAVEGYYQESNANVHRGMHDLSDRATNLYEQARRITAEFIGAKTKEIVFVTNTTMALNGIALSLAHLLSKEHNIVTTDIEHHSNLLPWIQLAKRRGIQIRIAKLASIANKPILEEKDLVQSTLSEIDDNTKILAITGASNVLGVKPPLREIATQVRDRFPKVIIVLDLAQLIPHQEIKINRDLYDVAVFSGHKMFAPMGIGVLWINERLHTKIEPFFFGGGMINQVNLKTQSWAQMPYKLEAGTPNVAGAIGLAEAIKFISRLNPKDKRTHIESLVQKAIEGLQRIGEVEILGPQTARDRAGLVSFNIGGIHPHDLAGILNARGVAIRAGMHCAHPLHEALGINGSARISVQIYNTPEEIDKCLWEIEYAMKLLG